MFVRETADSGCCNTENENELAGWGWPCERLPVRVKVVEARLGCGPPVFSDSLSRSGLPTLMSKRGFGNGDNEHFTFASDLHPTLWTTIVASTLYVVRSA